MLFTPSDDGYSLLCSKKQPPRHRTDQFCRNNSVARDVLFTIPTKDTWVCKSVPGTENVFKKTCNGVSINFTLSPRNLCEHRNVAFDKRSRHFYANNTFSSCANRWVLK